MSFSFWFLAALLILATLAVLLWPLLRQPRSGAIATQTALLREQLDALKSAHASGLIDDASFQTRQQALSAAALALIDSPSSNPARSTLAARATALILVLLIPLTTLWLYQKIGTPHALTFAGISASAAPDAAGGASTSNAPDLAKAADSLAAKMKDNPEDGQGWVLLGRTYRAIERFPEARLLRWDADTTGRKGAHEAILARFVSGGADILIGTQMIAKGLDLPRVTLVGVISADTGLHFPDFRSAERSFQLLSQVAGRAGRSERGGQVILQTYAPEHPAILAAAAHDYAGFYAREIAFRQAQGYPPFGRPVRLIHVTEHRDRAAGREAARVADALRARIEALGLAEARVIGPAPAFFAQVRGRRRWHLLVQARDPHALLADFEPGPGWRIDVDAIDLL